MTANLKLSFNKEESKRDDLDDFGSSQLMPQSSTTTVNYNNLQKNNLLPPIMKSSWDTIQQPSAIISANNSQRLNLNSRNGPQKGVSTIIQQNMSDLQSTQQSVNVLLPPRPSQYLPTTQNGMVLNSVKIQSKKVANIEIVSVQKQAPNAKTLSVSPLLNTKKGSGLQRI